MRPYLPLACCLLIPAAGLAQAPQSAGMWRVAAASLATPAALQSGPTGSFWNPATWPRRARIGAGVQLLQTPDAVGLSGILAGAYHAISHVGLVGVSLGRVEVRDLVRTIDSPIGDLGSIPVYEQFVGVYGGLHVGAIHVGGALRGHESRFDAERSTGVTLDFGLRVDPFPRLSLAAATHFLPISFESDATTDYYAGLGYTAATVVLWGNPTELVGRYGVSYREPGGVEHTFGGGAVMNGWLSIDGALSREQAFGSSAWRPAFQIGVVLGRYAATAARGSGINGLGATYRFALDVDLAR